jgi:hypothetical protein
MNQIIEMTERDEFTAAVVEALAVAHHDKQITYDQDAFSIRFEGTDFCLFLAELYKEYRLTPSASRPEVIRRIGTLFQDSSRR